MKCPRTMFPEPKRTNFYKRLVKAFIKYFGSVCSSFKCFCGWKGMPAKTLCFVPFHFAFVGFTIFETDKCRVV